MEFEFKPIGVIHSPFKKREEVPIQPWQSTAKGKVEVFPDYAQGLKDIEGFSHIILLYAFHKSEGFNLLARPFLDREKKGLFATRAPRRPNPIGLSVVRLIERKDNILIVENIDVLDGTPLLDIKPYVPVFDKTKKEEIKIGWLEEKIKEEKK